MSQPLPIRFQEHLQVSFGEVNIFFIIKMMRYILYVKDKRFIQFHKKKESRIATIVQCCCFFLLFFFGSTIAVLINDDDDDDDDDDTDDD